MLRVEIAIIRMRANTIFLFISFLHINMTLPKPIKGFSSNFLDLTVSKFLD